jgi:hypothetical protein
MKKISELTDLKDYTDLSTFVDKITNQEQKTKFLNWYFTKITGKKPTKDLKNIDEFYKEPLPNKA